MADYPPYEFQGRAECPLCHQTNREEWRVIDPVSGHRVGKRQVSYACACYGDDRWGETLSDEIYETTTEDAGAKRGRKPTGLRRPVRIVVALTGKERRAADELAHRRGIVGAGVLARVLLLEQIAADEEERRRREEERRRREEQIAADEEERRSREERPEAQDPPEAT